MKKSLYHIEQEALDIISQLEDGEVTEELEQALAISKEELQTKAVNYGFVIRQADYDIKMIDDEIKRLQALKKTQQNKAEVLKERIQSAMNLYGIEKVEVPTLKLGFRKSTSVEIVNTTQLPKEFMIEKITTSPDKKAIGDALKAGREVPGAILKDNQNLQIR